MTTIFVRTVVIYIVLLFAMRIMGKRQIGELDVSDLITTLLVSEIAALPITDTNLPISHAVIPITVLLVFEVISSALLVKFPKIKNFISAKPAALINKGRLRPDEMLKARISPDELLSELRQNGISDISEVEYAILEQNGKISVLPKSRYRPLTPDDIKIDVTSEGLYHIIIENGSPDSAGMREAGLDMSDIDIILKKNELTAADVYLMLISDDGKINIIRKKNK